MTKRQLLTTYRANDTSHLWPIRNKFNATERAIRHCRKLAAETGHPYSAEELNAAINTIVNNPKNW